MKKKLLATCVAFCSVLFLLSGGLNTLAQIVGHSASEIYPGTFNPGTYTFPKDARLEVEGELRVGKGAKFDCPDCDEKYVNVGEGAGGDLGGTFPNPKVVKLQGRSVADKAPTAGQVLTWTGAQWEPRDVGAARAECRLECITRRAGAVAPRRVHVCCPGGYVITGCSSYSYWGMGGEQITDNCCSGYTPRARDYIILFIRCCRVVCR